MALSLLVLSITILISVLFLLTIEKDKKIILIYFILLLATPWFYTSILASPRSKSHFYCNGGSKNFTCITSFEYVFFEGETNIHRRFGDYQLLPPSFIPLFLLGFYHILLSKETKKKTFLLSLPLFLLLGVFKAEKHFITGLMVASTGSLISTFGCFVLLTNFFRLSKLAKALSLLLLMWIVYEGLRMLQIALIHKPFITS